MTSDVEKLDRLCQKIDKERAKNNESDKFKALLAYGIKLARKHIDSTGTEVIPGDVYNIYECGHVYNSKAPNQEYKYFQTTSSKKKACPHPSCKSDLKRSKDPMRLISKYKICGCGVERLSNKVSPSQMCKACYKPEDIQPEIKRLIRSKQNGNLRDDSRDNCKHRLTTCIVKYDGCECIPCKGCKNYEVGSGNVDIMDFSERRISV